MGIPLNCVGTALTTLLFCGVALADTQVLSSNNRIALILSFGVNDPESTAWDGTLICPEDVTIENAGLLSHYPRKGGELRITSPQQLAWKGSSKCDVMRDYFKKRPVTDPQGIPIRYPLKLYSFLVRLSADKWTSIIVETETHGKFQFDPTDIAYGTPRTFLEGKVRLERAMATTPIGQCISQSGAIVYNDFPTLCSDNNGDLWTAYIAYTGRDAPRVSLEQNPEDFAPLEQPACNDQLMVVRTHGDVSSTAVPLTETGMDIFSPTIAWAKTRGPLVVWSQRSGRNWDLYASIWNGDTWSTSSRLTTDSGPDIYAALTATSTGYRVAWQSFAEDTFRIRLAEIDAETLQLGSPIDVTDGSANCWMPAIATDGKGSLAVAYDTYEAGNYDVFCALFPPGKTADPEHIPIATSPRFEDRASVAFDNLDRLWIAWEEAGEHWGKDHGRSGPEEKRIGELIDNGRTIKLACWDKESLRSPQASLEPLFPLQQTILTVFGKPTRTRESIFKEKTRYVYYPRLSTTADGRLCLTFRQHDFLPDKAMAYQTIWSNYVTAWDGNRWLSPICVSGSDGHRHCAPAICALPNGDIAIASAGDNRASLPAGKAPFSQNVALGRLHLSGPTTLPTLGNAIAAPAPVASASTLTERKAVQRMREFRTVVAGAEYRILRGDFHRHTAFSGDSAYGDGCIDDAFRYALDAAALDTMGNGDHDNGGGLEYSWYLTQKFYDLYFLPDHFVPMFSYERSVTANGPQGHRNIIMPRRGVRVLPVHGRNNIDENGSIEDTRLLFKFLQEYKFVSIPHTIATGAGPNFVDYAPDVDCVVEIYQGARNAYEYVNCPRGIGKGNEAGFYWSLLKAGKKYGVIASSDHRSTHMSYAMLYVTEMTREAVMETLRKRHCYAATDNILLDVRIGTDAMMGDNVVLQDAPTLKIHAVGTDTIQTVDIIRNAEIYHSFSPASDQVEMIWTDPAPTSGESSYYARIIQTDGEIAWGTPLWVHK